MIDSMRLFLETQATTLSECRALPGAVAFPMRAVFQPVRVRQTWPTRPRSDLAGHAAETRELPTIARRTGQLRCGGYLGDWSAIRTDVTERPILLLGAAGCGKSTLLAWECLERTAAYLAQAGHPPRARAKLPIHLRTSELVAPDALLSGERIARDARAAVVGRIAEVAAGRAAGATPAERAALRGSIGAALEDGSASVLLDDDTHHRDAVAEATLEAALRALSSVHPELEIVVTTRFRDAAAYDLRPRIWRLFEITEWWSWDIEAFVERVVELRRAPAPVRRRLRVLRSYEPIARLTENPRALALLCDAAIARPTAAPALLVRQVVSAVLAATLGTDASSGEVEREVELLERLAFAAHGVADHPAGAAEPDVPPAAVRAGLVHPATSADRSPWVLQRGLDAALAAVALARQAADEEDVSDPLRRIRTSPRWKDITVLCAGVLATTDAARAERLVERLLADVAAGGEETMAFAVRCAAQILDPRPALLERLVERVLRACEVHVARGEDTGPVIVIEDGSSGRGPARHELGLSWLQGTLSDLFRVFGARAEIAPLRRRLMELLGSADGATRHRTVTVLYGATPHDGRFRRALTGLLGTAQEHDDDVRNAATDALAHGAQHDPLLGASMLHLLDVRREPDVGVRAAAASIVTAAAPFDERLAQAVADHLDPAVEPSAVVRSSLLVALTRAHAGRERLGPMLLRCLERDPDPDVRLRAAYHLRSLDLADHTTALLLARLEPAHETSPAVRAAIAALLTDRAACDETIQRALLRHLDPRREDSDDVRSAAAMALSRAAVVHDHLRRALIAATDPDVERNEEVRSRASMALALAANGHDDARLAVRARLDARREPSAGVRLRALGLLRDMLDDPAFLRPLLPPLLDASNEPDWNVRRTAAEALGRAAHEDPAARQALLARLDVTDDLTQTAALGLAGLAATDAVVRARLLALVAQAGTRDEQTRACAAHALGHALEHAEVRETLLRHLDPWRERERLVMRMAAQALAPLAGTDATVEAALVGMLRAEPPYHPSVQPLAATLLREHGNRTARLASLLDGLDGEDVGADFFSGPFLTFGCAACRP